jgi:hypothetical protein
LRRDLAKRLAVLEAIAKQRVVSTWVDFVLWLDEHKDDEEILKWSSAQSCRSLLKQ